jgi:ABC-type Zn uptake system ZnuABC Zn-binding protein ZnuA
MHGTDMKMFAAGLVLLGLLLTVVGCADVASAKTKAVTATSLIIVLGLRHYDSFAEEV